MAHVDYYTFEHESISITLSTVRMLDGSEGFCGYSFSIPGHPHSYGEGGFLSKAVAKSAAKRAVARARRRWAEAREANARYMRDLRTIRGTFNPNK